MPAYSISKGSRDKTYIKTAQIPGVGAYQIKWDKISRLRTSPSASIGKTKKFFHSIQKQSNVGPGSYNPERPDVQLAASMKGRHKMDFYSQIPSPNQQMYRTYRYHNQKQFSKKQYSFGRSKRRLKTQQVPGPGQYQLNTSHIVLGGHFTKQSREKPYKQIIPGPGQYNFQKTYSPKKSQQFSFPREKKFNQAQMQEKLLSKIPGPGNYNISQLKKRFKGGKFNNAQRIFLQNRSEIPGPGSYKSTNLLQKRNPQAIIGSEKKLLAYKNINPGPGTYNLPKSEAFKKKNAYVVFLQEQRLKNQVNLTPGPGSYEPILLTQSRACSISPSNKKQKIQMIPGPLDYSPSYKSIHQKVPATIIGKQQRNGINKTMTPGPGNYKVEIKSYSKTVQFNKARRMEPLNSSAVGPGQYKLKPYLGMYDGKKNNSKQIFYV